MKLLFACALLAAAAAEPAAIRAPLQPPRERMPAPAFRLNDATGTAISLSRYRGKIVLLDFWATNCGGCKVEIPWFMELQTSYERAGLRAVGMSMEVQYEALKGGAAEGWGRVTPWLRAHPINYPVVMSDDAAMNAYRIKSLPATFLIDRRGRIAAQYNGLVDRDDIERNIKSLLAER
jgi:peroxiredoxin